MPSRKINDAAFRRMWGNGLSNSAIADRLGVSRPTVRRAAVRLALPPKPAAGAAAYVSAPPAGLTERPDYPDLLAALARGGKIGPIATRFRLPYAVVRALAGEGTE